MRDIYLTCGCQLRIPAWQGENPGEFYCGHHGMQRLDKDRQTSEDMADIVKMYSHILCRPDREPKT